jgi:hypothetical protein
MAVNRGSGTKGQRVGVAFAPYRIARSVPLMAHGAWGGAFVEVREHDRAGNQLYHHAWFTALEVAQPMWPQSCTLDAHAGRLKTSTSMCTKTMARSSNTTMGMTNRRCRWCFTGSICWRLSPMGS